VLLSKWPNLASFIKIISAKNGQSPYGLAFLIFRKRFYFIKHALLMAVSFYIMGSCVSE
jgi:hypothetical protein